jgi:NAD-reducing hydrogenase small subunit
MSFLDVDKWLIDLAAQVDLVYRQIADIKAYPEAVDMVLVEGAIANEEYLELIHIIIISFGDCGVTGKVTAMLNPFSGANTSL